MTVTVRAPLPSGLPPRKWGSPEVFANVAALAIAAAAPVFPHQNLEAAPPSRIRQLAEFIAPNLAIRTGAIAPARNIYDALPTKRWPEQFLFPSMATLPTAVPLRPALFDLPAKPRVYADHIPQNLAILATVAAAPPPTGFRDFVGPVPKRWIESTPFSSSQMPTAAPIVPLVFDGWAQKARLAIDALPPNLAVLIPAISPAPAPQFDSSAPAKRRLADSITGSTAYMPPTAPLVPVFDGLAPRRWPVDLPPANIAILPTAAPITPVLFDGIAPRRFAADTIAPNLVALSGALPLAPPVIFEYPALPKRKWIDSPIPPNVAITATIVQGAPPPFADYPGLPRRRWMESQPFGSTFMPTAPPLRPYQFETSLPVKRWQADEQLNYLVLPPPPPPLFTARDEFIAGRDQMRFIAEIESAKFIAVMEQQKFGASPDDVEFIAGREKQKFKPQ